MSDAADPLEDAFIGALLGEDELGVVVRAHIHIEARLVELLELLVEDPKYLEQMNLGFRQRVRLAVALGLKPEHAPPLSELGTLRNDFAHRLDTQLSEDRVDKLYAMLAAGDKEVVQLGYERTKTQLAKPDAPPFEKLSPKQRFIFISVALRGLLVVAIREIRAGQNGV